MGRIWRPTRMGWMIAPLPDHILFPAQTNLPPLNFFNLLQEAYTARSRGLVYVKRTANTDAAVWTRPM